MIGYLRRKTGSFSGWLDDPWCDNRMTRPISRDIAAKGESTKWIIAHRGLSALIALVYSLLVDLPLYVARFVGGVSGDLWRSDYSYTRYYGGLLLAGILGASQAIVDAIVWAGSYLRDLLVDE